MSKQPETPDAISGLQKADPYADPANPVLPQPDMALDLTRTALVVTDPQIDFLSPAGASWGAFGESITEHDTVGNLLRLFQAATKAGIPVVISPHQDLRLGTAAFRRQRKGGCPKGEVLCVIAANLPVGIISA